MPSTPLTVPLGTDKDWEVDCQDSSGNPVPFAGTETLSASAWPGDGQAQAFAPAVAFLDAPGGKVKLTVGAAQTAALEAGLYRLQAWAASGGRKITLLDGSLQLTGAPGSGAALSTYSSYSDLLLYCPWIEQLQDQAADVEGFQKQRHRARSWIDEVIQAHYRPSLSSLGPRSNDLIAMMTWGLGLDGARSVWLQQQLDAGLLMATDRLKEIASKKAAAFVCEAQVSGSSNAYVQVGLRMHAEAEALLAAYRAELDLNSDGYPEIVVDCGSFLFQPN